VTSATWIAAAVVVIAGLTLWATTYGRYIYAIGGNPNAARLAGLRVIPARVSAFMLSGERPRSRGSSTPRGYSARNRRTAAIP
jgi:ribose/xylose/arabinose/galactoside ABC-type transport system permease subunit